MVQLLTLLRKLEGCEPEEEIKIKAKIIANGIQDINKIKKYFEIRFNKKAQQSLDHQYNCLIDILERIDSHQSTMILAELLHHVSKAKNMRFIDRLITAIERKHKKENSFWDLSYALNTALELAVSYKRYPLIFRTCELLEGYENKRTIVMLKKVKLEKNESNLEQYRKILKIIENAKDQIDVIKTEIQDAENWQVIGMIKTWH